MESRGRVELSGIDEDKKLFRTNETLFRRRGYTFCKTGVDVDF